MWTARYDQPRYAYKMEWKIKKWSAAKKKALIEGRRNDLKNLSRCLNSTSHENWKKRLTEQKLPFVRAESRTHGSRILQIP
jgi:hypothetical protein